MLSVVSLPTPFRERLLKCSFDVVAAPSLRRPVFSPVPAHCVDELIGAESYITKKCRDVETAKKFMEMQAAYERNANNHGISAQNNPSGGNFYRGLYNIAIKSLGAAMKKSADQRLDACIDYAAKYNPVKGYQFMDSPGNDLESVCGQVFRCGGSLVVGRLWL